MFWGLVKNLSNNFSFSNNNHKTGNYSGGSGSSSGGGGGNDGRKRIAYNLLNMTDDEEDEDSDSGLQLSSSPNHQIHHSTSPENLVLSGTSNRSGGVGVMGNIFSSPDVPVKSQTSLSSIILKSQNKSNSINNAGVNKGKTMVVNSGKPGSKPNTNTTLTALKFTFEDFSDDSDYGDEDDDDEDDEEDEDEEDDGPDDVDDDGDGEAEDEDYENHDIRASSHVSSSTGDDESSSDFDLKSYGFPSGIQSQMATYQQELVDMLNSPRTLGKKVNRCDWTGTRLKV